MDTHTHAHTHKHTQDPVDPSVGGQASRLGAHSGSGSQEPYALTGQHTGLSTGAAT